MYSSYSYSFCSMLINNNNNNNNNEMSVYWSDVQNCDGKWRIGAVMVAGGVLGLL